jgi:uncharacterized protein YecA (UPF0149 family)
MNDSHLSSQQFQVIDALPQKPEPYRRPEPKIVRNQACPCGSGRKYKRCCLGKSQTAAA